jgi:hypothetical protein
MMASARELMSGFNDFVRDRHSAPSDFRADDAAITALYGRALSADVAVALTPVEAKAVHEAVMQLHRTARGVETMLAMLADKGAPTGILDNIKLPKRVVTSAAATVAALNAAHTAITARLPAATPRPVNHGSDSE